MITETGLGIVEPLWFIGVVENRVDERLEGRVQVRAFGIHGTNKEIPTEDLPWATLVVNDINFVPPPVNAWVFGFFVDGRAAQQPMILGVIPTQYTSVVDPVLNGWGVSAGQDNDLDFQGSRPQEAGQPTLNRLARGEDLSNTYVLQGELNRVRNIGIAGGQAPIAPKSNGNLMSQDDEEDAYDDLEEVLTIKEGIIETADALFISPVDLATCISYETAGTFDPFKLGPTTKYGTHQGLIQFGEPQARRYKIDFTSRKTAISSQLGKGKGIYKYLKDHGVKPGDKLLQIYAAINAGDARKYDVSDTAAGGTAGTVRDKVSRMASEGHVANAQKLLGSSEDPSSSFSSDQYSAAAHSPQQANTWEEPAMGYAASYPYNRTIETAAGHAVEIDDTPNNERIMIYHKDGSYYQITRDTTVIKSHTDRYDITEGNHMIYIGGSAMVTIDGDCHRLIRGNLVEEVEGDYKQIIHGNHEVGVAGQMTFNASDDANYRAGRLSFESNVENVNIKVAKTLRFESGETLHIKTKNLFVESTENTNIKAGSDLKMKIESDFSVTTGNDTFFSSGNSINMNSDNTAIKGDTRIDVVSSQVHIDDYVYMGGGTANDPTENTKETDSAESATAIEKPAPPVKKIPAAPAAAKTGVVSA